MAKNSKPFKIQATQLLPCGCNQVKTFTVTAPTRAAFEDARTRMKRVMAREAAAHICPPPAAQETPAAPATIEPTQEPTP